MLADMQTEVTAARALMWQAVAMAAQGKDALREISVAKLFAAETYVKVPSQAVQECSAAMATLWNSMFSCISAIRARRPSPPAVRKC
jgi:alkylation response protein AidB-like acyl-CoA dehydrogenase